MTYPQIPLTFYIKLAKSIYWKNGKPYWIQKGKGNNKQHKNKLAGTITGTYGYRRISCTIDQKTKSVAAHRLKWFMDYGTLPDQIDHPTGKKANNSNLRACTHSQNMRNRYRKDGSSYYIGVHRNNAKTNKWRACITIDKKNIYLGHYLTQAAAARARDQAVIDYGLLEWSILNFPAEDYWPSHQDSFFTNNNLTWSYMEAS